MPLHHPLFKVCMDQIVPTNPMALAPSHYLSNRPFNFWRILLLSRCIYLLLNDNAAIHQRPQNCEGPQTVYSARHVSSTRAGAPTPFLLIYDHASSLAALPFVGRHLFMSKNPICPSLDPTPV